MDQFVFICNMPGQPEIVFDICWNDPTHHDKVIAFWTRLKAMPPEVDPKVRARQLVHVALDGENVAGVTTAEAVLVPDLGNQKMFSFRVLINPDYHIPGLVDKISVLTRDYLESLFKAGKTDCIGVITRVENQKLLKNRREAVYRTTKLTFIGRSKDGYDLRVYYFEGAKITIPSN